MARQREGLREKLPLRVSKSGGTIEGLRSVDRAAGSAPASSSSRLRSRQGHSDEFEREDIDAQGFFSFITGSQVEGSHKACSRGCSQPSFVFRIRGPRRTCSLDRVVTSSSLRDGFTLSIMLVHGCRDHQKNSPAR